MPSNHLQQALQINSDIFRIIFQTTSDAVFLKDLNGRHLFINEAGARALGYSVIEILGKTIHEIGSPGTAQSIQRTDDEVIRTQKGHVDENRIILNGKTHIFATSKEPVFDSEGKLTGVFGIAREVTEQKLLEEGREFLSTAGEILSSSLDYSETLKAIGQLVIPRIADLCIFYVEEDGQLKRKLSISSNPETQAAASLMSEKYPPNIGWRRTVQGVIESQKSFSVPRITEENARKLTVNEEHYRYFSTLRAISGIAVPLVVRDRAIGVLQLFYTADSGRIYGEHEIKLAEDLGHRMGVAIENARLFAEAQESVLARDEFLAMVSHELKSPVSALKIQIELLLKSMAPGNSLKLEPSKIQALLASSETEITRLSKLLNDLFDISGMQKGQLKLELETFDLRNVIRQAVQQLTPELTHRKNEVIFEMEDPVIGKWDRTRLEQVFRNMISNASKYGQGKPITIKITKRENLAIISVKDQGIGIQSEKQSQIFERFNRAVSGWSIHGLGLGLFIVRQILTAHGGSVRVESQPGQGSNFIVELPLVQS